MEDRANVQSRIVFSSGAEEFPYHLEYIFDDSLCQELQLAL
jgi:hypothetical protein